MRGLISALVVLASLVAPAAAQTLRGINSFITPFPQGDVYRTHVIGDWYADGLEGALQQLLSNNPHVRLQRNVIEMRSLRRSDWDTVVSNIEARSGQSPIDIAVVMYGVSEIGSVWTPQGNRARFGTDEWKIEFAVRVDRVMKALKGKTGAVYWLGMPIVRRSDRNEGYQVFNELIRERAYINGVKYIDVYASFADENENFSSYGPDVEGKNRLLRTKDGNYFTSAGYLKLAHFAVREIKRDLSRARSERSVPLAGSELEQRRARPAAALDGSQEGQKASPAATKPVVRLGQAGKTKARTAAPAVQLGLKRKSLNADNGTVVIRSGPADNRIKSLTVPIVRPAISAAVLDLVTRKQSRDQAARLGDIIVHHMPGGPALMSSVTPADRSGFEQVKQKLSPTQSPFFKVWAKGERLPPKPGRADDWAWPPEQPELVRRVSAPPPSPKVLSAQAAAAARRAKGLPPLPSPNPLGPAFRRP